MSQDKFVEPKCTVCKSPLRDSIDQRCYAMSVSGETFASIARTLQGLSPDAIERHFRKHCPEVQQLIQPPVVQGYVPGAFTPLSTQDLYNMVDLAAQAFNEAIAAGNTADATKSTEMIVRLKNLIQSEEDKGKAKVVTDLTSMPEWQVLASKILHALTPYPEALKAVRKVVAYNDTTDTIVPEVTNNDQP